MHFLRTLLFFALIVIASPGSALANESSCATVRMDQPPGSVSSLPVFNQGSDTGLCYAVVAAQMADAYLASTGHEGELVSFSHAAALYQDKMAVPQFYQNLEEKMGLPSKIVAGKATEAERKLYDDVKKNIESQIFNPNDPHAALADLNTGDTERTLLAMRQNKWSCAADWAGRSDAEISSLLSPFLKLRQDVLRSQKTDDFSSAFACAAATEFSPDLLRQLGDLKTIADKIVSSLPDKGQYILSVIENSCAKRVDLSQMPKPKKIKFSAAERQNGSPVSKTIQDLLDHPQPLPIGISFEGSSLYKKAPQFPHWAMIVGREEVGGVCQVIIRDSYGTACTGPFQSNEYKYPCKNGQISVPLDDLSQLQVTSATYLEK
jgi:hypothetical protein